MNKLLILLIIVIAILGLLYFVANLRADADSITIVQLDYRGSVIEWQGYYHPDADWYQCFIDLHDWITNEVIHVQASPRVTVNGTMTLSGPWRWGNGRYYLDRVHCIGVDGPTNQVRIEAVLNCVAPVPDSGCPINAITILGNWHYIPTNPQYPLWQDVVEEAYP